MRLASLGFAVVLGCAGVTAALATEAGPVIPKFVDETASAGVDSVYKGEWQYMVGGGAASFDCNDDGYPELLLAGGEQPAKFYRNASTKGGALKFVAEQSGLGPLLDAQPRLRLLGEDGCKPPNRPVTEVYPIIRHGVTAWLRHLFGVDAAPTPMDAATLVANGVTVADRE